MFTWTERYAAIYFRNVAFEKYRMFVLLYFSLSVHQKMCSEIYIEILVNKSL